MNLIQRQVDDFLRFNNNYRSTEDQKDFVNEVRLQMYEYKKDAYKLEFLEHLRIKVKLDFDRHDQKCTGGVNCPERRYYEDVLFFVQEEIEEVEQNLSPIEFTSHEKIEISETLKQILTDLNQLKEGQRITYDDFDAAIQEIKDYYFLNKKTWGYLLTGKLTEMVAGGLISETISKSILKTVTEKYQHFILSQP